MHLQALSTVLSLLPLALCDTFTNALDVRSPSPNPIPNPEPTNVIPNDPYFMLTSFEAFIPSPAHQDLYSRAGFNLTLMHPVPSQRFTTYCMAHTSADTLCDPTHWTACEKVEGAGNEDERLSFRFGEGLASVDIMRNWVYTSSSTSEQQGQTMHMRTTASEPTNWDENSEDGNVTVGEYGKYYKRPAGWVFAWRQTVG